MSKKSLLTAPDSFLVSLSYGKVSYVLLMASDGSTTELRGAQMWRWLKESLPLLLKIRSAKTSSQTLLPLESDEPDRWRENPETTSQDEKAKKTA